jgi:N-acetylmuramoyl-L-alanine amidase
MTTLKLTGQHLAFDIGHGLNNTGAGIYDPGATGGGLQEHKEVETFVAALAVKARSLGATTSISHDRPLRSRKAIASDDATSWHMNAGGGTGVEVWIPLLAGPKSYSRSDKIGHALAAALNLPYRGTKRTSHLSVLNTGFDRLVELDFIDSAKDRAAFANRHDSAIAAFLHIFPDTSPIKPPVIAAPAQPAYNRVVTYPEAFIRLNANTNSKVLATVHKNDRLRAIPGGTLLWAKTTGGYILRTRIRAI